MLYFLPLDKAGKFGSITLFLNLFSVIAGFESHICLQREIVNKSKLEVQILLKSAINFFSTNYLIIIPFLIFFLYKVGLNSGLLIFACIIIAISEHLCNAVYNISLVNEDYINSIPLMIYKNIILIVSAVVLFFFQIDNSLYFILDLWAILSLGLLFLFFNNLISEQREFKLKFFVNTLNPIIYLYKNTYINFLIGTVAVLSLQFDRFIVSLRMTESEAGIYFRHVSLIAILYQLFNIVSYNRIVPKVFSASQQNDSSVLRKIIFKEYRYIFLLTLLGAVLLFISYTFLFSIYFEKFRIDIFIILILLVNFVIRANADFLTLIYNAFRFESRILSFQIVSLIFGISLMSILIPVYKINGVLFSIVFATTLYTLLMNIFCPKSINIKKKSFV